MISPVARSTVNEARVPLNSPAVRAPRSNPITPKSGSPSPVVSSRTSHSFTAGLETVLNVWMLKTPKSKSGNDWTPTAHVGRQGVALEVGQTPGVDVEGPGGTRRVAAGELDHVGCGHHVGRGRYRRHPLTTSTNGTRRAGASPEVGVRTMFPEAVWKPGGTDAASTDKVTWTVMPRRRPAPRPSPTRSSPWRCRRRLRSTPCSASRSPCWPRC